MLILVVLEKVICSIVILGPFSTYKSMLVSIFILIGAHPLSILIDAHPFHSY